MPVLNLIVKWVAFLKLVVFEEGAVVRSKSSRVFHDLYGALRQCFKRSFDTSLHQRSWRALRADRLLTNISITVTTLLYSILLK